MADNIFDATLDVDNDVKVNNFDWSHANNLTTQIGRITPIFCDLVPAKTSFRVNPRFGLQFMPMVFPIQTRMKARISFYRYPLRALWKDYKDFIGNFREGLEEPYINFNTNAKLKAMASTGSLGDYLGLPTTLIGKFGGSEVEQGEPYFVDFQMEAQYYTKDRGIFAGTRGVYNAASYESNFSYGLHFDDVTDINFSVSYPASNGVIANDYIPVGFAFKSNCEIQGNSTVNDCFEFRFSGCSLPSTWQTDLSRLMQMFVTRGVDESKAYDLLTSFEYDSENSELVVRGQLSQTFLDSAIAGETLYCYLAYNPFQSFQRWLQYNGSVNKWDVTFLDSLPLAFSSPAPSGAGSVTTAWTWRTTAFKDSSLTCNLLRDSETYRDVSLDTCPWYNSSSENKDKQQKILAYGFRAYEGIYNAFMRDNRNNPYYLNGQVQYNKWIPNDEGGADNELYELHYANWEKDFLTTAVQSPQQGNAPLVGITTYTQTVDNGDGTRTELIKTALVDEDGKKYGLSFKSSDEGLEGVEYVELDNGTAVRQARSLYDLATSGISIPDLRMVNCYQKFLELNMRKGYSYKDIVEGRFAVKVRYADLLLPEFFGGVSRDIDVNSVTQTVDQNAASGSGDYATALGSQSGLAGVRGEANANIECFCDEESIIMGILVVTPLPVYTQLLPKHFTYRGLMEHYQPEFNLIGFQPIKYNEVCPIQAYNDNPDSLTETFGYNRPWYEYAQKYDVAHGLFRTNLSNFLMHRVFDQKPALAKSFLLVDPEQVTDVFAVTETTDKIYGQIWLDCTCKLPIARVAIPRLD
jgi:hypothetical protein